MSRHTRPRVPQSIDKNITKDVLHARMLWRHLYRTLRYMRVHLFNSKHCSSEDVASIENLSTRHARVLGQWGLVY